LGLREGEITGQWRKLHNEELYDLYSSTNAMTVYQIRKNKLNGAHSTCRERRGADRTLVEKPKRKRPL
jgi:hypothetical protein